MIHFNILLSRKSLPPKIHRNELLKVKMETNTNNLPMKMISQQPVSYIHPMPTFGAQRNTIVTFHHEEAERVRRLQQSKTLHKVIILTLIGIRTVLVVTSCVVIGVCAPNPAIIISFISIIWFSLALYAALREVYCLLIFCCVIEIIQVVALVGNLIIGLITESPREKLIIIFLLVCAVNGALLNSLIRLTKLVERG